MKFTAPSLAIACLLGSNVAAVKLTKEEQVQMKSTFDSTFDKSFAQYKNMSDKDIMSFVQKKTNEKVEKKAQATDAIVDDAEAKAVEKIVAQRIWGRIYDTGYPYYSYPSYPYYQPYYYPYQGDIAGKVAAITAYHDVIARAEAINAIAGMVAPSADMALKILQGAVAPNAPPTAEAAPAAPKDKTAVQLEAEGVPVLIEPKLLKNDCEDCDLKQKDYILDGINGIDFVQTKSEGVPVFVEPKLLKNDCEDCDLMQRDIIVDGINGIGYVQLDNLQRPIDDITLQVQGVPVTVYPESILRGDTMGRAHLNVDVQVGIKTEILNLAQKDKQNLLQTDAQISTGNPVWNPPFNNWSVNQPSPPHDHGDRGDQDLELRDVIIDGVNGYDLVQTGAQNPVWNPPFNNWSVNQPSPPHDHGLAGAEDMGQDMIVGGDPVHYSKKTSKKM